MLIDEPLMRNVLLKEYHSVSPDISKEQRIAELRKQIEDLENDN